MADSTSFVDAEAAHAHVVGLVGEISTLLEEHPLPDDHPLRMQFQVLTRTYPVRVFPKPAGPPPSGEHDELPYGC